MKLGGLSLLDASAPGLRTSDYCLLPSSFCLLPSRSAVGGGGGGRRRIRLGGKRGVQVLAGAGKVRLESQGFLELADGFAGAALPIEGGAQVAVGLDVIR